MSDDKLTQRQEAFARMYAECGNASESYRQCYTADNMTDNSIGVEGHRTLSIPKVSRKIAELQAEARERSMVTIESITKELDEDRKLARKNGQAGAAVQAVMNKAKLHGLVINKTEVTRKRSVEDLDDSEIDALIASAESREDEAGDITPEPSSVH